jgi:hypothetical protein
MVLLYAVRLSLASPHGSWYDKMIIIVEKSEDLPLWINAIVPPWPTCWWG